MSLLSGACLSAGAFEFIIERWSTCQGTFFIMSLLSGASIIVRILNLQLGIGLPVGGHFS